MRIAKLERQHSFSIEQRAYISHRKKLIVWRSTQNAKGKRWAKDKAEKEEGS
jgi:hypothetical protein